MFTGIIEATGRVVGAAPTGGGTTLHIDAGRVADDANPGASIAVNGACLTISHVNGTQLSFDVIKETLKRTTLGQLKTGDSVNLERSLALGDRLDGHFVQGHVDGQARLARRLATRTEFVLWFEASGELMAHVVPKGSIAVDGVSLTVAAVSGHEISVALTPTTLQRTALEDRREGDPVNIETDILVRTVVHTLSTMRGPGGITLEKLGEHGFV